MSELLALTAIEELFLWQNRPEFPCNCFVRHQFSGMLLRPEFELAINKTLDRHPLLRSIIVRRGRNLFWSPMEAPKPNILWNEGPTGIDYPAANYLDIWSEIGLRLYVVEDTSNNKCDLIMQFHHSCCDGIGMLEFTSDFLVVYAGLTGDQFQQPSLSDRDIDGLRNRGNIFQRTSNISRLAFSQLKDIVGVVRFFLRTPKPVVPHRGVLNNAPLPANYPATCSFEFNRQELAGLRMVAKRNNVMLNDILVSQIYGAVAELRAASSEADDGDWIRMMIPTNLRVMRDKHLPAANVVSCTFLDFRISDIKGSDTFLSSVHRELKWIKDLQLGYTFIFGLKLYGILPGGMKSAVTKDECSTSCLFSNLGRVLQRTPLKRNGGRLISGNVILEKVEGLAPLQPYNAIAFVAVQYAGRMIINAHYDPRVLTKIAVEDMIVCIKKRIVESSSEKL